MRKEELELSVVKIKQLLHSQLDQIMNMAFILVVMGFSKVGRMLL